MISDKILSEVKKAFPFVDDLGKLKEQFINSLYHHKFETGAVILDETKKCTGIILVLSGSIRIYKLSEEGKEITLYNIGRGETCVLTVSCFLGSIDVPFPVAASAQHPSEAVFIPIEIFRKFFFESPAIQKYFFSSMSAKFYSVLGLLENITFKRTSDRLTDYLLTKTAGGSYPLYSTHEAIAAELGTAREVISRLLKEMENSGYVSLSRGKIVYRPKV